MPNADVTLCQYVTWQFRSPEERGLGATTPRPSQHGLDRGPVGLVAPAPPDHRRTRRCESVELRHVDNEPVPYVALQHALVGFIDVRHLDQLDVRRDIMLG